MSAKPRYQIRIKRSAEKEMDAFPKLVFNRLSKTILSLEDNPRPHGCKKLHGLDGFRLRSGEYRILYTVDDQQHLVEIISVGHRRDVYRGI